MTDTTKVIERALNQISARRDREDREFAVGLIIFCVVAIAIVGLAMIWGGG